MSIFSFFADAFASMGESAREQHRVNRANIAAVKAENRAIRAEAKAMRSPKKRKAQFEKQLHDANKRRKAAEARIRRASR